MANGRLVIGLTGPLGSGVSTLARSLANHGKFHHLTVSERIKAIFREKHHLLPLTDIKTVDGWRQELQDIGNNSRLQSASYWIELLLEHIPNDKDVVIDGIRNTAEATFLRDQFPHFFLVAVTASPSVRWNRVQSDYGGNLKEFEDVDRRDADEDLPNGQQVTKCIQLADFVMLHDTDLGSSAIRSLSFYNEFEPELRLMRAADRSGPSGDYLRPPNPDEVNMAVAYAQSHMSQCLKRHVGAVIIGQNGLPLSSGFNENPEGMKPCRYEYKYCFKDEDMHKKLEGLTRLFCPKCGKEVEKVEKPWLCSHCGNNLKLMLFPSRNMELCTAIHAEERAIRSLHGRSAQGGTLYSTTFPCFQCARYIKDAGIRRVVYVEAYPVKESDEFLRRNGIVVEPFKGFKARAFNQVFKQVD